MRHGKSGRKLNRTASHRMAMFRNMVTSLLQHERIYTTIPKAKEMRRWAEWMITLGKRGDLHARRQALTLIQEKQVVHKLFAELGPRYQNRSGGYTRILKVGYRRGDASPMCLIELITDAPTTKKARPAAPKTTGAAVGATKGAESLPQSSTPQPREETAPPSAGE